MQGLNLPFFNRGGAVENPCQYLTVDTAYCIANITTAGQDSAILIRMANADGGESYTVDWGDGTVETYVNNTPNVIREHTWANPGIYTVTITGSTLGVIAEIDFWAVNAIDSTKRAVWEEIHFCQLPGFSGNYGSHSVRQCNNLLHFSWTGISPTTTTAARCCLNDINLLTVDIQFSAGFPQTSWQLAFQNNSSLLVLPAIDLGPCTSTGLTNIVKGCTSMIDNDAYGARFSHTLGDTAIGTANMEKYINNLGSAASSQTLTITGTPAQGTISAGVISDAAAKNWTIAGA